MVRRIVNINLYLVYIAVYKNFMVWIYDQFYQKINDPKIAKKN